MWRAGTRDFTDLESSGTPPAQFVARRAAIGIADACRPGQESHEPASDLCRLEILDRIGQHQRSATGFSGE
jgi:hypothetical protein